MSDRGVVIVIVPVHYKFISYLCIKARAYALQSRGVSIGIRGATDPWNAVCWLLGIFVVVPNP